MPDRPLTIFVSHPSSFLTDCQPHGDGLAAYEFISRLADRGNTLHVAVQSAGLEGDLGPNVTLHPVPKRTPADSLKHVEYAVRVWQLYQQLQRDATIDLIHQMNPVRPGLSSLLSFCAPPLILGLFVPSWPRSAADEDRPESWLQSLARNLMEQADRVQQRRASTLLLSTPAARSRMDGSVDESKLEVLPYGVDVDAFSPSVSSTDREKNLRILYLGRLHRQKGIFVLLDAMQKVLDEHPTCSLDIAGSGPAQDDIERRISEMPHRENIRLLGQVDREDVPRLFSTCALLCLPSLGEPFGLTALEAMASGKPIVGTDAGGLAHIIPDEGGRKVPPGDPDALAEALIDLLSSPERRQTMGEANRSLAMQRYSWDSVIDRLETIYHTISDSLPTRREASRR